MNSIVSEKKIHGIREESPLKPDSEPIEIDHVAEKKLVRKLDLHIVPIVMLLYLFSFLDRQVSVNIRHSAGQESNQSTVSTSAMLDCTD